MKNTPSAGHPGHPKGSLLADMADALKHPPWKKPAKMKANGGYGGYGGKIKLHVFHPRRRRAKFKAGAILLPQVLHLLLHRPAAYTAGL
jgi:hypothetical protein